MSTNTNVNIIVNNGISIILVELSSMEVIFKLCASVYLYVSVADLRVRRSVCASMLVCSRGKRHERLFTGLFRGDLAVDDTGY